MNAYSQQCYPVIFAFLTAAALANASLTCESQPTGNAVTVCFAKQHQQDLCNVKKRRKAVEDTGWTNLFHGWADVQGQGAPNDYCRFVGYEHERQLSCALAGPYDKFSDRNYNSSYQLPPGIDHTWYMKDEDGDGRDDYCRCLHHQGRQAVVCTKAGPLGFYGSPEQGGAALTFVASTDLDCISNPVSPQFGKPFLGKRATRSFPPT